MPQVITGTMFETVRLGIKANLLPNEFSMVSGYCRPNLGRNWDGIGTNFKSTNSIFILFKNNISTLRGLMYLVEIYSCKL